MYYQYLTNTGYSNGYEMPTGTLKGYDIGLANPTPYTRTTVGGRSRRRRTIRKKRRRTGKR